MGCDIHFCVEVRGPRSGKWRRVSNREARIAVALRGIGPGPSKERRLAAETAARLYWNEDSKWPNDQKPLRVERNYGLFAALARVRWYNRGDDGDAGILDPDFGEPRGLPEDVSPEVRRHSDGYGEDGHSHSWLSLRELSAVPPEKWRAIHAFEMVDLLDAMRALLGDPASEEELDRARLVFFFDN